MQKLLRKAAIRVYYCRNSAHAGGLPDAVGKLGLREDVYLEAVPCSGRIDPRYILKAFEGGAEAVCIVTCPVGECRMMEGNLRAARRVHIVQEILAEAGLDPNAVRVFVPGSADEDDLDGVLRMIGEVSATCKTAVGEVVL